MALYLKKFSGTLWNEYFICQSLGPENSGKKESKVLNDNYYKQKDLQKIGKTYGLYFIGRILNINYFNPVNYTLLQNDSKYVISKMLFIVVHNG